MFIIVGKSCSGKNAVATELEKRGYKRCITYTTRPMRDGEVDGVDYHFISNEKFFEMRDNGEFAEYKTYIAEKYTEKANAGKKGVGYEKRILANELLNDSDKKFIILTPDGVRDVKRNTGIDFIVIYLFANLETIQKRLKNRGDDPLEAKRRIETDIRDFKGFELESNRLIYNNLNSNIESVVDKIELYLSTFFGDGEVHD